MYTTGICTSFTDIKDKLITECVNVGWTQTTDSSGYSVIYKGDLFLRIIDYPGKKVAFRAQTDIEGTSAHPNFVSITNFTTNYAGIGYVTFPGAYHFFSFTNPDEVYFIYNYEDKYQFVAFGQSNMASILPGTGMWITATDGYGDPSLSDDLNYPHYIDFGPSVDETCASAFFSPINNISTSYSHNTNTWINSNIDINNPWYVGYSTVGYRYIEVVETQPWLNRSVLLPLKIYKNDHIYTTKYRLLAEIQYSRYYNMSYVEPEDVITNGYEEWKIFPSFKKGDGGNNDTGNRGWAIRSN